MAATNSATAATTGSERTPIEFEDTTLFEECSVSQKVTADNAPQFFKQNGVFYEANEEVGRLVESLSGKKYSVRDVERFKNSIQSDSRLAAVFAPFLTKEPLFCLPIADEPGNFYSLDIEQQNQDHRAMIYMWRHGTKLEFSHGSHTGPANGRRSHNGLVLRPYVNLHTTRGLKDVPIDLEKGGMMIVHPRLAFQTQAGRGIGFGCERPIER